MTDIPEPTAEAIAEVADCARDIEELVSMTRAIYGDHDLTMEQMESIWMDYWETVWVGARQVDATTVIRFLVGMVAVYAPKDLGAETGKRLLRVLDQ